MNEKTKFTYVAGIHVLVQKGDKYLLLKRSTYDRHSPGCWDLPGGGVEFDEQPLDAAIRETKEEAGVDIELGKILYICSVPFYEGKSIETYVEGIYKSGEVILSDEHTEFVWVKKEDISKLEPEGLHVKNILLALSK